MKLSLSTVMAVMAMSTTVVSAFAPLQMTTTTTTTTRRSMSTESDDIEAMVEEELGKSAKMGKMRTQAGFEYAPWLKDMSPKDEANMRQIMKEKAAAIKKRELQEQQVSGQLLMDSQAQELSGVGLRFEVIDGNSVELEWATASEKYTNGFQVKRRPAKTSDFDILASWEDYGPLASKGDAGGVYRYLDENVGAGGWVYRITECETNGSSNDLSQCLVEIQTEEEQLATKIAAIGIGVLAILAVVGASLLDPMQ